jgi:short-subunit dehydrogenase
VWVNNAGTSMWGSFEDIPLESQARLIELNLLGAIYGCHAALPYFFDSGGRGVIINVSSIFGRVPMPWAAGYTASKAGLAGFTEALRFELSSHSGIEVCAVYPRACGRADRWAGAAATPVRTRRRSTRLGHPVRARARLNRTLSGEVGQALLVSFGTSGGCFGRRPVRDSRRQGRSSRRLGNA